MSKKSVGIIGGGLAGLTAAYLLKRDGFDITVIEARKKLGGRIYTKYSDIEAPIELGATWLGKKHTQLIALLSELGLEIFEQYMGQNAVYEPISTSPPQIVKMPFNPDPTYRIKGGSAQLINQLALILGKESVHLNTTVLSITDSSDKIYVQSENRSYDFDNVIITIPPKLFIASIRFQPSLPTEITKIGHQTQTWMSESIKVALTYAHPFWKDEYSIGSIFSNTGLISEMYDHSNFEESKFALKGFINGGYAHTTQDERKNRVIAQLTKYFGSQVSDYLSYQEVIWRNEKFTHSDYDGFILPHQNNGNPIFQSPLMNNKLFISGSETASKFPGYMDGAVESGITAANRISKALD